MAFRDSILEISPPFLLGPIGSALQYASGDALDAIGDWMIEGVQASMPGYGPSDALHLCGRDMQIDRGPNETNDHYIDRLQRAVASHRIRGSGPELLRQLNAWFSPSTDTQLRLVNNRAVWHEIDTTNEVVTKTNVGDNWQWDSYVSTRWWRGWVIIDSSAGPWTADVWDEVGAWDDGGTWDSDMTVTEAAQLTRIVDKWKPARIAARIIVTFDSDLFEVNDSSGPNPDGDGEESSYRAPLAASFHGVIL